MYKFCQRNLFFSEVPKVDLTRFGNKLFNSGAVLIRSLAVHALLDEENLACWRKPFQDGFFFFKMDMGEFKYMIFLINCSCK